RAKNGFKQSDLAERIHKKRAQITRWFSTTSNLTIDSVSDLMVGLGMDFDSFPFTPIEKTLISEESTSNNITTTEVHAGVRARQSSESRAELWMALAKELRNALVHSSHQPWPELAIYNSLEAAERLSPVITMPAVSTPALGAASGKSPKIQEPTQTAK